MIGNGTTSLAQSIERAQVANETRLAEQLNPSKLDPDADELKHWRRFRQWADGKGCRSLPAKPATVASWIANEAACGLAVEAIEQSLRGIELIHSNANLANPVACPAPRAELEKLIGTTPPRSWRRSEAGLFASLPPEVRAVIARRARQDELAVRKAQHEAAALRNPQQQKGTTNG